MKTRELIEDIFRPATQTDLEQRKQSVIDKYRDKVVFKKVGGQPPYQITNFGLAYTPPMIGFRYMGSITSSPKKIEVQMDLPNDSYSRDFTNIKQAKEWVIQKIANYREGMSAVWGDVTNEDIFKPASQKDLLTRKAKEREELEREREE